VRGNYSPSFDLLITQGFSRTVALSLAEDYDLERIQRQVKWQNERQASRNRLGMLRKAIEEDWPQPEKEKQSQEEKEGEEFAKSFYRSLAGRSGISLLPMSDKDVRLGTAFLKALNEEGRDRESPEKEGSYFGDWCRSHQTGSRSPARSLSLLITLYAEGFMESRLSLAVEEDMEDEQEAKRKHEECFTPAFKAWEAMAITRAMKEHPGRVE
jgi:hypothetical protein